jgi:hypothetical protein
MDLIDKERIKAAETLPDMLEYLNQHPERHTPFMDRWFELCCNHATMVYAVKRRDGAVGRRLLHGKPQRVVECIESAAPLGKRDVWFVRVVKDA